MSALFLFSNVQRDLGLATERTGRFFSTARALSRLPNRVGETVGEMVDPSSYRPALEAFSKRSLAQLLYFASWEPVESLDHSLKFYHRALLKNWKKNCQRQLAGTGLMTWKSAHFVGWRDHFGRILCYYPDDPLDKRTLRLKKLFDKTRQNPVETEETVNIFLSLFLSIRFTSEVAESPALRGGRLTR